jgi:glycosyltransferase involved in cell wall biosynthesis
MKIALVCPQFLPNVGGLELQVYNIAKRLVKRKHEVTIITSNLFGLINNDLPMDDVIDGIIIKRVKLVPFSKFNKLLITPNLISELFKIDFDIFHIFSFLPTFITNVSCMVCYYRNKPLVITPTYHPYRSRMYNGLTGKLIKFFYDDLIGLQILKMADGIVSLTESEADYYRIKGLKKVTTIPVGVDLDAHKVIEDQVVFFKNKYGINGATILFVGRIEMRKGVPFLLKSMPEVLKKFPDAKLVMVGNQPDIPSFLNITMEKLGIRKNVLLLGKLNQVELSCAYESADVVVVPSLFEAFSHIVIEAWAHKKPIIASKNIGLAELISNENGILVDYGDPKGLAKAIIRLIEDKRLSITMGNNGYQLVREKFNWEDIASKLEEYYYVTTKRRRNRIR